MTEHATPADVAQRATEAQRAAMQRAAERNAEKVALDRYWRSLRKQVAAGRIRPMTGHA